MTRVLLCALLGALVTWAAALRADERAEAKKHFEAGVTLIKAEDFAAAAVAFETSLDLYPTRMSLFNLANCYKALQRYGEALETILRLEREFGDKLGSELESEMRIFRASIENLVGTLALTVEPAGASITVAGRPVGTSPLAADLVLGPGDYEVEASLDGWGTVRRTVRVASRRKAEVTIKLERQRGRIRVSADVDGARVLLDGVEMGLTPLESPLSAPPGMRLVRLELDGFEPIEREVEVLADQQAALFLTMVRATGGKPARLGEDGDAPGGLKTWGWVTLGVGAAALIGGGVVGGLALSQSGKLEDACPDGGCSPARSGEVDALGSMAMAADIMIGVGAAAAVAGLVMLLVPDGGERAGDSTARIVPVPGGAALHGRF